MRTDKTYLNTLWQRVSQEDDQKSFEELFYHCYQRLVRFAVEYVHAHEPAEEIVSDIFLKLWSGRGSYREVLHIEKYLFTAVRNQSLNYLRQFSTYRVINTDNPEQLNLVNAHDPYKASEWKELLARLDEAVESLPPQRRKIFRLVREEGFKPGEVAEIMNLSPRTVETHLFKAVKTLHTTLRPYLPTPRNPNASIIDTSALLAVLIASAIS